MSLNCVAAGGVSIRIALKGNGNIVGTATQHLASTGSLSWGLTLANEKDRPTVTVTRSDNGACALVDVVPIDMSGRWNGTFTLTDGNVVSDFTINNPITKRPETVRREECEKGLRQSLGKQQPMILEFQPETPETGTVVAISQGTDGKTQRQQPQRYKLTGDVVTIDLSAQGSEVRFEGKVRSEADKFILEGQWTATVTQNGRTMMTLKAEIRVSKPIN